MLTTLFRIFSKTIAFVYFFLTYFHIKVAYILAFNHFPFKLSGELAVENGFINFKKTGNKISANILPFFSAELPALVSLLNNQKAKIIEQLSSGFVIQIDSVSTNVLSVANLVTVNEIFVDKLYDFFLPQKEVVIVDIGMNVGCASLFFSKMLFVEAVYAYEPFPGTYKEAVENIAMNQSLSSKVTAYNFGISNFSGQVEVPDFESGSAVANIHADATNTKQSKIITLKVKSITEIIDEVASVNTSNNELVLKIDCEGEEYVIMELLVSSGYLQRIYALIIEWHIKGAESLLHNLHQFGFTTFNLPKPDGRSGMIYAFK